MVVHDYYPDTRVTREARAAVQAGFAVDVYALRAADQPPTEVDDGIRIYRRPFRRNRAAGLSGILREYLGFALWSSLHVARATVRQRYDLVQIHNPPDFLIGAAFVPRLRGAAIILDIHDLAPDVFGTRYGRRHGARLVDAVLRSVERGAAAIADEVVTVHEPYRRELIKRGVPPRKVTVVMNSVDETLVAGLASTATPERQDGIRVVYHGAVTPPYGVGLLVDALELARKEVDSLRLDIYGDGDAVGDITRRAAQLGVANRVRLHGSLPHRQVLEAVAGAAVGVIPNPLNRLNRFALSTKLFEYVLLGIPVVSSDLPTIREHFSDDEVLFYEPGDAASLATALVAVVSDPDGAARRAAAARARYEEYRWTVSRDRYLETLRRAIAGREIAPCVF
jgi:glycosyltransferase involved in cell wall biosynthesis